MLLINNEVERIFAMPFMDQSKTIKLFPNDSPIMAALWKKEIELHGGFKYHYAAKLFEGKKQFHKNGFTTPEFKNFMYGYRTTLQKFGYPLEEILKFTLIPVDAMDAIDAVNAIDDVNAIDAVNAVDAVDAVDDLNVIDAVENPVQTYTTKQQFIKEDNIPKNKSYSEWLPLQKICRVLPNTPEAASSLTNLLEMETVDLFAFVNSNETFINRSSNAIIRYNVMKGQAIEQLVIRAKKSHSRSKICDVYAEVNASLKHFSIEHNCGFVEINHKRMQELRVLGKAAKYLELEKYDLKCSFKKLIRRVPQIVKEANSLKPVIEKRPAAPRRAAPVAKKQRVE